LVCLYGRQNITQAKRERCINRTTPNHISARKRQWQRPYAVRKPKEYEATEPGDIVEVDTLDVRPLPGMILKHFTARDIISRLKCLALQLLRNVRPSAFPSQGARRTAR